LAGFFRSRLFFSQPLWLPIWLSIRNRLNPPILMVLLFLQFILRRLAFPFRHLLVLEQVGFHYTIGYTSSKVFWRRGNFSFQSNLVVVSMEGNTFTSRQNGWAFSSKIMSNPYNAKFFLGYWYSRAPSRAFECRKGSAACITCWM